MLATFNPLIPKVALSCLIAVGGLCAPNALAQDAGANTGPSLDIELNSYRQVNGACRLIFMANNRLGANLTSVSFETVLIDMEGIVDRLTVFDFQDLQNDRTRVRQFDLPDTQCGSLGSVLINGAATCEGDGIDARQCMDALNVSTRADMEISG